MTTALEGPLLIYGDRRPIGSGASNNPNLAPSLFALGAGLFDTRLPYNVTRAGSLGFSASADIPVISAVPSTLSATNMAAAQVGVAATPLTLVAATGAGITVLAAALTVWPSGNVVPAAALAVEAAPGLVAFGLASPASGNTQISIYDPTLSIARNVRVTSVGDDHLGTIVIAGYDVYGYPMTETITLANAGIAAGKKAFKFIVSATPAGTLSGSNISLGTGDVYGLPIRADQFAETSVFWDTAWVTSNTGFVAAVTTSPATSTTGDVRGTYATQSASNGTRRLMVFQTPAVANLATNAGLFGVQQA